jgi:hypothetical protein
VTSLEQLAAAGYEATVVHPGPKRKGKATILVVGDGLRTYVREDDAELVEAIISTPTGVRDAKPKRSTKKGSDA